MKKSFLTFVIVPLSMLYFSGCAKYFSTSSVETEKFTIEKEVPIKVEVTQTDWSIVINLSEEQIKKDVHEIVKNNPIFEENDTSKKTLKIDIKHSNEHGGAELGGAFLTGLSLYIIPSVADSVVDITMSMDDISSTYTGELVVAQGSISRAFVNDKEYTSDEPMNLMKNLIKNALNEFTVKYMKKNKVN